MTSHETALEAAAQALADDHEKRTSRKLHRDLFKDTATTAISAYISTLSPDVSGLVERLRSKRSCTVCEGDGVKRNGKRCGGCNGDGEVFRYDTTGPEAADALASLSLQLVEATERRDAAELALGHEIQIKTDIVASLSAAQEEKERLRKALEKIERWFGEFPPTGDYWPGGGEMSYAACYGSNGERDFMRGVAREALTIPSKEDKTDAEN